MHIYNMYNPYFSRRVDLSKRSIPNLIKVIQNFFDNKHLAMRDFNLYYSAWGGMDISQNDKGASILLKCILEKGLEQVLPLGTVIYRKH